MFSGKFCWTVTVMNSPGRQAAGWGWQRVWLCGKQQQRLAAALVTCRHEEASASSSLRPLAVLLGAVQEKEIARMVCLAFGQKVCGFDLLRSERGTSFVCDVNGWSFVKNSHKVGHTCSPGLPAISHATHQSSEPILPVSPV